MNEYCFFLTRYSNFLFNSAIIVKCDPGEICNSPVGESAFFYTTIEIYFSIVLRKTELEFVPHCTQNLFR